MSLHMSHVANLLHVQTIHLCHHSILADAKSIQKLPKAILAAIWSTYINISKMIKHDKDTIKKAQCAREHCTFPQTVASCCIMLHHACVAWTQFCPFWPRPRPRPHVSWSQMPEAKVRSPLNILKQSDTKIYKVWFYKFRICEFEFAPVDWQIVSFHRYWQTRHVAEAMTWLFHWPFHSLLHWPFQSPFHWYSPSQRSKWFPNPLDLIFIDIQHIDLNGRACLFENLVSEGLPHRKLFAKQSFYVSVQFWILSKTFRSLSGHAEGWRPHSPASSIPQCADNSNVIKS